MEFDKPLPVPTPTARPFWDALNEDEIHLQQCDDCGTWVFYPRTHCNNCLSERLTWKRVSGQAVLYSFTKTHQPTAPHFADEVPQRIAIVELKEGVRLTSTLVNVSDDKVHIGMRLKPFFDHVGESTTLLRFEPE